MMYQGWTKDMTPEEQAKRNVARIYSGFSPRVARLILLASANWSGGDVKMMNYYLSSVLLDESEAEAAIVAATAPALEDVGTFREDYLWQADLIGWSVGM